MEVGANVLIELLAIAGSCAAVYAAIRADLATAIATAEQAAAAADKAHDRIDRIITASQQGANHG